MFTPWGPRGSNPPRGTIFPIMAKCHTNGKPKVAWSTVAAAYEAAVRLEREKRHPVSAYSCPHCGGIHIGRNRPPQTRGWWENEALRGELGVRAVACLKQENSPGRSGRREYAIGKRVRSARRLWRTQHQGRVAQR
jgi:predicted RNA-binding Zn-ribbon protein involved in translation (DUF1610 family)